MTEIDIEKNKILDEIIANRRTIRDFKPDVPPKESIEAILKAGLQAPFAAMAVIGEKRFRRFFVLKERESMNKLAKIIQKRIKVLLDNLSEKK